MATEQTAVEDQNTDDEEGLKPGEVEVELGDEEDGAEGDATPEVKAEPTQEERKTRRERREEHERKTIAAQVQEQLEARTAKMRQELTQEFEQKYRPPTPEPKVEPVDDNAEVKKMRRDGARLLRLMKDPDTSDEEVRELKTEYQDLQDRLIREIAKQAAPKPEKREDPLEIQLRAEFPEFYQNQQLMAVAREYGAKIAKPGMHGYAVARQAFTDIRAARAKKQAQTTSPEQASKYGSATGTAGARESSGGGTRVVISAKDRNLALRTYSDKTDWSDDKKIQTWVKKQKSMGLLD